MEKNYWSKCDASFPLQCGFAVAPYSRRAQLSSDLKSCYITSVYVTLLFYFISIFPPSGVTLIVDGFAFNGRLSATS